MHERLIAAFVGFTVAVLALFGIPRAYQVADLVQAQEQRKVERSADLLAVLLGEKVADGRPVTTALLETTLHQGEHVVYVAADGSRTESGGGYRPTADDLEAHRSLPGGGSVTLSRSGDLVEDRVSDALLPLVVIVILLLVMSAAAGWMLARRLARPFQQLAGAARELGTGHFALEVPRSAIPEAEQIGTALRSSAEQLDVLLRHERELAVHASHELRTPVTALRLELEDLALWPQTPPEVAEQLRVSVADLDRLSAAITDLLDRSRRHRVEVARDVEVTALVAEVVRQRGVGDPGEVHVVDSRLRAHVDPASFQRVIGLLLDGVPGRGPLTVEAIDAGQYLEVRVQRASASAGAAGVPALDRQADEAARGIGGQILALAGERPGIALRLARPAVGDGSESSR